MNLKTRKLMTMHKALHLIDGRDILYVSRKRGGRGFTNIQDSVDGSMQRLGYCIKKAQRKTDKSDQKQNR